MSGEKLKIYDIRINQMKNPIGIDEETLIFSWKISSGKPNTIQKKVHIQVGTKKNRADCWDSGILETDCSIGIPYKGSKLEAETRYYVRIKVWDEVEESAQGEAFFETGMRNSSIDAWEGAKWIGAPEFAVAADTLSVFVLESTFSIEKGSRAGVVFGANDFRLLDRSKNEQLLSGENYIRFVLNIEKIPASIEIYRVGYAPEDRADKPLYELPAVELKTRKAIVTEENKRNPHKLTVEVEGNGAYTYLDGYKIDEVINPTSIGEMSVPCQLNPLGAYDVTTFPRLCEIGYYVGEDSEAQFDGIHVRNLRKPCAEILSVDTEKGVYLKGECQETKDPSCHSIPMIRRSFEVKRKVARARLYATARGIYECSINGKRVSEEYFAPGASQYDKHLMYQTYDVTDYLIQGENGIGCILASGWWSDSFSFRLYNYNYWGDKPAFLGKLVIIYEDGGRDVIVTEDTSWDYFGEGPFRYAGFYNGEQFDARKAYIYEEFSKAGFSIEGMKRPAIIKPVYMEEQEGIFPGAACWPAMNETEPQFTGNYQAPVREVEVFTAKSMTEPLPGVYIYDLGQEIAGVPRIRFREKKGTKVILRFGEILYPELKEYEGLWGQMLQANLREASNTDVYICGGGEEIYQPRFTFHGYRYVEISGVEKALPIEDVKSVLLSSVQQITGEFQCDNELLNRFVKNVCYSQFCNFISIPTDCPQRNERMGWLGDTHIFCRTATYQSDVKNFYLRNLQAMKDMQTAEGRFPSIAPFGGGFGGLTYECAMILMVWELYQQYGDISIIEEYYDSMARWMESIRHMGIPGMPKLGFNEWLGDWLAPSPADDYLIWNAFHYRDAYLMEKYALLLGKESDARKYQQEAEKIKKYWNNTFVEKETGKTKNSDGSLCDVQGSYSIALNCGVFADEYVERAYGHLARVTEEGNYTIQSGFFGTGPLNPMLSKGGYPDIAQKTITQTAYPSWLYPVTQGATTIWERWNSFTRENGFGGNNSMNSFNHYSLGSVLSWLYENTLGIQRNEAYPGFKRFTLKPEMGTFGFAKGGIDTPHGRIESGWEKTKDGFCYCCTIPVNTKATLILGGKKQELGSGTYSFHILQDE